MEGISVAQSAKAKKTPKVLARMEIEPKLGGGHIITHHYKGYQHDSEPYGFGKDDGDKAMAHIAKHAGLEEQGGSEPEPHWTKEKE